MVYVGAARRCWKLGMSLPRHTSRGGVAARRPIGGGGARARRKARRKADGGDTSADVDARARARPAPQGRRAARAAVLAMRKEERGKYNRSNDSFKEARARRQRPGEAASISRRHPRARKRSWRRRRGQRRIPP